MSFVNPEGNGVRVLSLDGGDTRCLSQLLMLQELMHRLEHDHGRPVRPCEYFHSITGVGASGLIAILLGFLGMTVENAMKTFTAICEKVFPPEECDEDSRSEKLTREIEIVLDELDLPHGTRMEGDVGRSAGCHVSICYSSASINGCRMFRNYKSKQFSYNPTIIETVRATWATPGLFSSARIGPPLNQEELVSAVNGFNNPALEAAREARDIFGRDRMVSTFISLGSGTRGPVSISSDGFLEKSVQQTENVEESIERLLGTTDIYFRFSPQHTIQGDYLSHERQIEAITSYTRAYVERERISRSLDDFLRLSAHTSNINLQFKDTAARLIDTTKGSEPHPNNAQALVFHSSYNDNLLLAELRISGLQCGSPVAGCMDGTREDILQRIVAWTTDFAAPNILWLKGHPGVGKSAIAAKIVEELGGLRCLGSSFFFQRQNSAALTPQALWRTVAYDLARRHPSIRKIIVEKLQEAGVGATTVNVEKLFRHLIHEPLAGCEDIQNAKLPVIVIDALDECGGLDGHHSQYRKALMKTLENWSRLPGEFKLIVTSRTENDIERLFSNTRHYPMEVLAGQTVDPQSSADIQMFLTSQFQEIAVQYPRSLSPDWPGTQTVKQLAEKAAGLFIWAETIIKFITAGEPPGRLNQVLQGGGAGDMGVLYEQILNTAFREPSEDLNNFHSVVGAIILAKTPLSFPALVQLLSIEEYILEHICNGLQSVLDSKGVLQFHHQSFVDFLLDQKKCPPRYLIGPITESRKLALACFRTMRNNLRFNICALESSHFRNADLPDLPSREKKHIHAYLSYSCSWWASHLAETEFDVDLLEHVRHFMHQQFLWWLEVLSVTKRVNLASQILLALIDWIPRGGQENDMAMAKDMRKFVAAFASVISQSVPHIYLSALPFSPQNSAVSKRYRTDYPQTLTIQTGGLSDWPALQNVLTGHTNRVASIAFSPDGKRIASGSWDNTIRVWDAQTGEAVTGPFEGHSNAARSVAFSPDGKHIGSGSYDSTIRVWDAETGKAVAGPFEGHGSSVNSVAFSPEGTRIVSGSWDKTIRVWDAVTGEVVAGPFKGHSSSVTSVAFSLDGRRVVSGSSDNTIRVWDAETGKMVVGPFEGHINPVNSVAFSPDGKRIVSGSSGRTIRVWDAATGEVVAGPFKGHSSSVTSVAFSPDGTRVVSGSWDETIRVWDAATGEVVAGPFKGHSNSVNSVAFSPDGENIISGSSDKTIRVWDAGTGKVVAGRFEGHSSLVNSVAFSPDGKRIVSGSSSGTIRVWDADTGEMVAGPFESQNRSVKSVAFSPDGKHIVSGSYDNAVRLWNAETGKVVAGPFKGHSNWVNSVAFSPDGKHIVSGSWDKTIRVWDAVTGEVVAGPFKGHSSSVTSVAFSPDGMRIVSGSWDETIRVWDADTGMVVAGPLEGHSNSVTSVAFSPDGGRVISGSSDKTIRVWDAETGEVVAGPFEGQRNSVNSVTFSPDGKHIVSGSSDNTIRVLDAETGKVVAGPFEGHMNPVNSVAFSPDGKHIVSGSSDNTIRVWDATPSNCGALNQTFASFRDSSKLEDGWMLGADSELLFWVPPTLRDGLWRPGNSVIIGQQITTQLDLNTFIHGDLWHLCKVQQSPSTGQAISGTGSSSKLPSSLDPRERSVSQRQSNSSPIRAQEARSKKRKGVYIPPIPLLLERR